MIVIFDGSSSTFAFIKFASILGSTPLSNNAES